MMGVDIATDLGNNDRIDHYDERAPMITEVSAVNFRQNLGEMLSQVQYRNDSIVIKKDGKPVAALVDAALFDRIRRMRERFNALSRKLSDAYADVPIEEGLAEINALSSAVRKAG